MAEFHNSILLFVLTSFLFSGISCSEEKQNNTNTKYHFFVGTYTQKEGHVDGKGKGIYDITLDIENKKMTINGIIQDLINPSFLCQIDSFNLLAVNEISPNPQNYPGRISRIELNKDSTYRKAQEAGTYGNAPCHITYSKEAGMYAVTNYLGGQLVFGSITSKGELASDLSQLTFTGKSTHPRQEASHLHQALFTADGGRLLVSDLGSDKIYVLQVDKSTKKIEPKPVFEFNLSPGSGPRHMCWGSQKDQLFIVEELANRVTYCQYDTMNGNISAMNSVSILSGTNAASNTGADIHLSPGGNSIFVSSRGENNIVMIPFESGKLGSPQFVSSQGKTPRNFAFTKDGKYLLVANQDSGNIVIYENNGNGKVKALFEVEIPSPVCLVEKYSTI